MVWNKHEAPQISHLIIHLWQFVLWFKSHNVIYEMFNDPTLLPMNIISQTQNHNLVFYAAQSFESVKIVFALIKSCYFFFQAIKTWTV